MFILILIVYTSDNGAAWGSRSAAASDEVLILRQSSKCFFWHSCEEAEMCVYAHGMYTKHAHGMHTYMAC